MRARFIGDPQDGFAGPHAITVFGVDFEKDVWRPVSNAKFAAHSHFEFDGDGDGEDDPDVEALKAELDGLGVKYHHKAGPARLAELLAEAKKETGE